MGDASTLPMPPMEFIGRQMQGILRYWINVMQTSSWTQA